MAGDSLWFTVGFPPVFAKSAVKMSASGRSSVSVKTAMSVNELTRDHNAAADDLAQRILDTIQTRVDGMEAAYSPVYKNRFVLHAQVGLDSDIGVTSGVRIPVGGEPEDFFAHLRHSGRYHGYFPAGVGDIFPIAPGTGQNPAALLDVVKGAFAAGMHYMSFYAADTDLVRITGYLVKRSEMDKYRRQEAVLQNTTQLGAPNYDDNRLAERKVRMV